MRGRPDCCAQCVCLYKGTYVANLSEVDNVYEKSSQPKQMESLPAHLQDLYQRSVKELTTENAKVVKELLIKYSHLFAANDADLGQTKMTGHIIDNGTTSQIKQHRRQLPIHMEEEADRHVDDMLKMGVN